jgi:hypothetical protein
MPVVRGDTASPHRPKDRRVWLQLSAALPLILFLFVAGVPFFQPIFLKTETHGFCIMAGAPRRLETNAWGLGSSYGGDYRVIRVGNVAWMIWWQ